MKKIWVNPFEDFRDSTLFLVGVVAYLMAGLQAYWFRYVPDGIFQAHIRADVLWYAGFVNGAANIVFPAAVLFVFGRFIYAKTRFFDVLNVLLIAQIVNYLIALFLLNPFSRASLDRILVAVENGDVYLKTVSPTDLIFPTLGGILAILLLLYFFYLLVVGIRVATNSKKLVHRVFTVLLVIGLDMLMHFFYPYM